MATRLVNFYNQVSNEYGMVGRMKLAMLTKIPSEKAADAEDSPANIAAFERAIAQLRAA